jgi:hypothetical protein
MNKTSNTEFIIFYDGDTTNAYANMKNNLIEIGCKTFTTETLVHEISELTMEYLLKELGYVKSYINREGIDEKGKKHHISHIMSPYGIDSLIYPTEYTYEDTFKEDFDVSKYEEVLI